MTITLYKYLRPTQIDGEGRGRVTGSTDYLTKVRKGGGGGEIDRITEKEFH